jgi:hypothetical protein
MHVVDDSILLRIKHGLFLKHSVKTVFHGLFLKHSVKTVFHRLFLKHSVQTVLHFYKQALNQAMLCYIDTQTAFILCTFEEACIKHWSQFPPQIPTSWQLMPRWFMG